MLARARPIAKAAWTPAGVEALEDNALLVATSEGHRSVIAGPGAGKTELLAQRAAFLLQTGTCPAPQRILAISYKRDAARNLTERVGRRCHRSHAARLDSQTFDAFAKSLVDRFGQTLPAAFRPRPNYKILEINKGLSGRFLGDLPDPPVGVGTKAQIMALNAGRFERNHLLRRPLPANGWGKLTPGGWAAAEFWSSALHEGKDSFLSFGMIGRLAELLLRTNPMVQQALRLTYSHLFMDEFQDTTQVQYDLVRTIFLGGTTVVTAVGD
ncbi:MAG: UvrD-helicase domain-containing protein, partial [Alphaproteobacteria bacterium]|nr:UvrD-helicase domain-containing protein [Alphaproteobacteria bacterium]